MLSRIVYFFLFNVINSISITYVINDDKERMKMSEEMHANQRKLTGLTQQIYKQITDKNVNYTTELEKPEYKLIRNKAMKEMSMEM